MYPALAVAEELRQQPAAELLYVGSDSGLERELVERRGLRFAAISVTGGVRGTGMAALGNAAALVNATRQADGLMSNFRPEAILATGGYVCAPVVVSGWLRRVPSLVYLPDTEPGWAVRFLGPFARLVAVTVPESARFFRSRKVVCTGYPVRPDVGTFARHEARAHFGIPPTDSVLLVTGGSRGAFRLNQAVTDSLESLLDTMHVIHVCGQAHHTTLSDRAAGLPERLVARYHLFAYLHEMPMAMAAADLALSRAGASVLGEYPAAGLPSILVPLSLGHRDQERNAAYMAAHGAALVIGDSEFTAARLTSAVSELLGDPVRLSAMSDAARAMAQPFAALCLADELTHMASRENRD